MQRIFYWLVAALVAALAAYLFFARASDGNIVIQPPIDGVSSIRFSVVSFDPPLQFRGRAQVGGGTPPDWVQAQLPAMYGNISEDKYSEYFSKEYIQRYGKYFGSGGIAVTETTIFYGIKLAINREEYVIATSRLTLMSTLPKDMSTLLADLYKKIDGRWLAFPPESLPIFTYIPWQNPDELKKIILTGRATVGPDRKLKAL